VTRRAHPGAAKHGGLRQRGSALVEQALVVTLLLTVIFGIIDLSRAAYAYHFVANAAREATRWASVRSGVSPLSPHADNNTIYAYISNVSGMGLDPASISTTTTFVPPPHGTPNCPVAAGPGNSKPGCVVQVTVNYSYTFFFPFLPTSPIKMSSSSQMVITQ